MTLHLAELGLSNCTFINKADCNSSAKKLCFAHLKNTSKIPATREAYPFKDEFIVISETDTPPKRYEILERMVEPHLTCRAGVVPLLEKEADKADTCDLEIAQKILAKTPDFTESSTLERSWEWIKENPVKSVVIGSILGAGTVISCLQNYQNNKDRTIKSKISEEKSEKLGEKPLRRTKRTVLGKKIGQKNAPYAVGVSSVNEQMKNLRCGGTIISNNQVLTAAHCIRYDRYTLKPDELRVTHGSASWSHMLNTKTMQYKIKNVAIHPAFKDSHTAHENDFAVLTIEGNFRHNACSLPLITDYSYYRMMKDDVAEWTSLHSPDKTFKPNMFSMGWGTNPNKPTDSIHYVELQRTKIIPPCENHPSMLCVGDTFYAPAKGPDGKLHRQDTCQGDSGGPLVYFDAQTGVLYHAGLVSSGEDCGEKEPAVYANTASAAKWIRKQLDNKEQEINYLCDQTKLYNPVKKHYSESYRQNLIKAADKNKLAKILDEEFQAHLDFLTLPVTKVPSTTTKKATSKPDTRPPLPINKVPEKQAPYMVGLRLKDEPLLEPNKLGFFYRCGGTIISHNQVLTAAHCLDSYKSYDGNGNTPITPNNLVVMHGSNNWQTMYNSQESMQYNVAKINKHPSYNVSNNQNDIINDYAILTVERDFPASACAMPLITDDEFIAMTNIDDWNEFANSTKKPDMYSMGWGKATEQSGWFENNLKYAELQQIHPIPPCLNNQSSQLCVANNYHGLAKYGLRRDTCQGDSGGPLIWVNKQKQSIHLAGVVSYSQGCGRHPAVYSNLHSAQNWIQETVLKSESVNNSLQACEFNNVFIPEICKPTTTTPKTTTTILISPSPKTNITSTSAPASTLASTSRPATTSASTSTSRLAPAPATTSRPAPAPATTSRPTSASTINFGSKIEETTTVTQPSISTTPKLTFTPKNTINETSTTTLKKVSPSLIKMNTTSNNTAGSSFDNVRSHIPAYISAGLAFGAMVAFYKAHRERENKIRYAPADTLTPHPDEMLLHGYASQRGSIGSSELSLHLDSFFPDSTDCLLEDVIASLLKISDDELQRILLSRELGEVQRKLYLILVDQIVLADLLEDISIRSVIDQCMLELDDISIIPQETSREEIAKKHVKICSMLCSTATELLLQTQARDLDDGTLHNKLLGSLTNLLAMEVDKLAPEDTTSFDSSSFDVFSV